VIVGGLILNFKDSYKTGYYTGALAMARVNLDKASAAGTKPVYFKYF
jgi:hypothetical protein